eukprot:comp15784_c0_seq1/m.13022 comp15784_c0_seq1/g.13022  ORF comp15784_c0_seq1/g.13022 comp15784_c0_seq1/m.13022 type:complete len:222 (-) comp15784_c0_seq1:259-924(-)
MDSSPLNPEDIDLSWLDIDSPFDATLLGLDTLSDDENLDNFGELDYEVPVPPSKRIRLDDGVAEQGMREETQANSSEGEAITERGQEEKSKRTRKSYTLQFKLKVALYREQNSIGETAKHFGLSRKQVSEWSKQHAALQQAIQSRAHEKKVLRAARGVVNPEFDVRLFEWAEEKIECGENLSRGEVREEARRLAGILGVELPKDDVWVSRWGRRHGMVLVR